VNISKVIGIAPNAVKLRKNLPLLLDKSAGSGFGRSESARRVPGRTARKHWVGVRRINTGKILNLIPSS
jgi:hypothetical protein